MSVTLQNPTVGIKKQMKLHQDSSYRKKDKKKCIKETKQKETNSNIILLETRSPAITPVTQPAGPDPLKLLCDFLFRYFRYSLSTSSSPHSAHSPHSSFPSPHLISDEPPCFPRFFLSSLF